MTSIPHSLLDYLSGYFHTNLEKPPSSIELSERSWKQMLLLLGEDNCVSQSESWLNNFSFYELLPVWEEWQKQLQIAQEATGLPFYLLHISFSQPVIYPDRLSLSSLLKLYDNDRRLQIRIKISCFTDHDGRLWWEVGFVHTSKSFEVATMIAHPQRHSYYLLSGLVANTWTFMQQRSRVNGIHLSPAYYHVWPLSFRIARQYPRTIIEEIPPTWLKQLDEAIAGHNELIAHEMKTKAQRQFIISRLLQRKQLSHPKTGAVLNWHPPAIVILR